MYIPLTGRVNAGECFTLFFSFLSVFLLEDTKHAHSSGSVPFSDELGDSLDRFDFQLHPIFH